MKFLYLLVDLFTAIVPFIFSFHPKLKFYKNFKAFFISKDDLIAAKLASGRLRDLADAEEVRAATRSVEGADHEKSNG